MARFLRLSVYVCSEKTLMTADYICPNLRTEVHVEIPAWNSQCVVDYWYHMVSVYVEFAVFYLRGYH